MPARCVVVFIVFLIIGDISASHAEVDHAEAMSMERQMQRVFSPRISFWNRHYFGSSRNSRWFRVRERIMGIVEGAHDIIIRFDEQQAQEKYLSGTNIKL